MKIKFFVIPIKNIIEAETEVNSFLSSHRILTTNREFVNNGDNSYWALQIEYIDSTIKSQITPNIKKPRVDYKEILSDEDFIIFSRLRELRKKLAEKEGVPVYTIFTNEQLSEMSKRKIKTKSEMLNIDGIGEAKTNKYAELFLSEIS